MQGFIGIYFISLVAVLLLVIDSAQAHSVNYKNKLESGYKICVLGDGGFGNSDQLRVAQALRLEGCHEFRYVGDIIYPDGIQSLNDPLFMNNFYNPYSYLMNEQGSYFYLVMGNHDYRGRVEAWFDAAEKYEKIIFPNYYYLDVKGDICFFNLNTMAHMQEQVRWLESLSSEIPQCKLKLSFAHHPYKSVGQHSDAYGERKTFLEASVVGQMDAYFSGHDHNLSYEGQYNGTELFVSGAAGQIRRLKKRPKRGHYAISAFGYIALIVNRNEKNEPFINYEFRVLESRNSKAFKTTFTGVIE